MDHGVERWAQTAGIVVGQVCIAKCRPLIGGAIAKDVFLDIEIYLAVEDLRVAEIRGRKPIQINPPGSGISVIQPPDKIEQLDPGHVEPGLEEHYVGAAAVGGAQRKILQRNFAKLDPVLTAQSPGIEEERKDLGSTNGIRSGNY